MKDTCSATTNTDWCLVDDSVHQVWYNTKNGQTTLRKPSSVTNGVAIKKNDTEKTIQYGRILNFRTVRANT